MKKSAVIAALLLSGVVLVGCKKKEEVQQPVEQTAPVAMPAAVTSEQAPASGAAPAAPAPVVSEATKK